MSKLVFLKSLRELLAPLKRIIDKKAENVNWNENDPSASGYIANRTHYKIIETVKLASSTSEISAGEYAIISNSLTFEVGKTYTVMFNGIEYVCVAWSAGYSICIGNGSILGESGFGGNEPFVCDSYSYGECYVIVQDGGTHTIEIYGDQEKIVKIPSEYLPNMIGKSGSGQGAEIFNDYSGNVASGEYSHAEGRDTTASDYCSHAEGYSTSASGRYSHAEGSNTSATESFSHAEGYGTKAIGSYCHAEGNQTEASGYGSHAEGQNTFASGEWSHAEGDCTLASSSSQHVQGRYNIEDASHKYAHIVGNGTYSGRKNAHTIDWNGLGWFAGGLKVGGTGQDDANAKSVATEDYVHQARDGIAFIDQVNGYTYIACMREGSIATYCGTKSLEVITMPTKTEYMIGEYFNPDGMVVVATAYDGTTKEIVDFTYTSAYITYSTTSIEITYVEGGIVHTAEVPVTMTAFDPAVVLVDFNYADNGDGTYTITGWKGTYNGEPSTEIIIPNNGLVIV